MPAYYVATVARYVLVEAANEDEARRLAEPKLRKLYAGLGTDSPIRVHTARLATPEEVELQNWHEKMIADELGCEFCQQSFNRPDGAYTCPYCGQDWNVVRR